MITVKLGGTLKGAAGGQEAFEIEAANVRQMLTTLEHEHPQLKPLLAKGVAVAINGQIYRDAWYQAIPPNSEVFLLPQLAGG